MYKLEEIIHESDFSTSIKLGDDEFGIIANSKTEDAIIFEIEKTITEGEEKSGSEQAKLEKI